MKNFHDIFLTKKEKEIIQEKKYSHSLQKDLVFCEYDLSLNLSEPFLIENSVINLLLALGFSQKDAGCKYLMYIISECVINMKMHPTIKMAYESCAKHFTASVKSVEISIVNSIKSAGASTSRRNLSKLNEIFQCEYVVDRKISNALFISAVSQRLMICKKYGKSVYYTG